MCILEVGEYWVQKRHRHARDLVNWVLTPNKGGGHGLSEAKIPKTPSEDCAFEGLLLKKVEREGNDGGFSDDLSCRIVGG